MMTSATKPKIASENLILKKVVAPCISEGRAKEMMPPLLGLCDQLSPRLQKSTPWLREVKGYYQIVTKLEKACRSIQPALSAWASAEMKTCSRYVAVVLDQNLSLDLDQRAAVRSI